VDRPGSEFSPHRVGATYRRIHDSRRRLGGVISGSGGITVNSGGNLQLSAINTYAGAATINDGGSLTIGSVTSAVTVNSKGLLGGNGTITGNVTNGGTIAPGSASDAPTTLTINGKYGQTRAADSNSTYHVKLYNQVRATRLRSTAPPSLATAPLRWC
jgi:uncharacterized protein with beta-barrel porin domain